MNRPVTRARACAALVTASCLATVLVAAASAPRAHAAPAAAVASAAATLPTAPGGDWTAFGRDPGGSQYSPLAHDQRGERRPAEAGLGASQRRFLQDAPLAKGGTVLQTTPLHANGSLYFCTPWNKVIALDPASGRQRWVFDPHRRRSEDRQGA